MERDLASFFKKIFKGSADLFNPSAKTGADGVPEAGIFLAVSGKHPGWNDYMDDLGLESERLVAVKRLVYLEGIGGNLSAWGQMDATKRLDGFQHSFVLHFAGEVIAGRLWSSSDGMGRRLYPMMVVVQCIGCEMNWVMAEAFPLLAELQKQYQAITTAAEVRALTDEARTRLRASAAQPQPGGRLYPHVLTWLAQRPEMGKDQRGLLNLIYEAEERLSMYGRQASDGGWTTRRGGASYHMRMPTCEQSPGDAIRLWLEFLFIWLDPETPVLAVVAETGGWVDVIVGDAAPSDLYCLEASPKTIPFNTDIPYNLDGAFVTRARKMIRGQSGES
ncbi:MAG: hypothetical protein ABSH08_08155 [Tepidisphaeraceae bacterium]